MHTTNTRTVLQFASLSISNWSIGSGKKFQNQLEKKIVSSNRYIHNQHNGKVVPIIVQFVFADVQFTNFIFSQQSNAMCTIWPKQLNDIEYTKKKYSFLFVWYDNKEIKSNTKWHHKHSVCVENKSILFDSFLANQCICRNICERMRQGCQHCRVASHKVVMLA